LDQTSDPPDAPEGTIYYNKQSGVFRCKIPSGWVDCVNQGVLPPQDGPWVRIPNLDTGDPNEPTIKLPESFSGSFIFESGWKSYILPRNVVKVRVRGVASSQSGVVGAMSCGFHTDRYNFSGVIFNENGFPPDIVLRGAASLGDYGHYIVATRSIYSFCAASYYNDSICNYPSSSYYSFFKNFGPYSYDIRNLPSGRHAGPEQGGRGTGMFWHKAPGTTIIPAGSILYMDARVFRVGSYGHPYGVVTGGCIFEVMFAP